MNYLAYVQPVRKFGFEQWRAVIQLNGTTVWECRRWSEAQARTEALRAMFKFNRSI